MLTLNEQIKRIQNNLLEIQDYQDSDARNEIDEFLLENFYTIIKLSIEALMEKNLFCSYKKNDFENRVFSKIKTV